MTPRSRSIKIPVAMTVGNSFPRVHHVTPGFKPLVDSAGCVFFSPLLAGIRITFLGETQRKGLSIRRVWLKIKQQVLSRLWSFFPVPRCHFGHSMF